jgi:hypothetical protein
MIPQPTTSPEEREQLLQTIEMFAVIVQASPEDTQSLAILKDAYLRTGQQADAMVAAKQLADAFAKGSQYEKAVREYEWILEIDPTNVEAMAALGELEETVRRLAEEHAARTGAPALPAVMTDSGRLMATVQTVQITPKSAATVEAVTKSLVEDGNESLARFLLQHRVAPEDVVKSSLERVAKKNKDLAPGTMAHSYLEEVVRRAGLDMEATLCTIVDRSKFAYIPLEYYEVDRQVVKMLPESITLSRLVVPFDVMSRTLMIAMANPFDTAGKDAVQQLLDFNIQWHLASPQAIQKILSETYKVAAPGIIGSTPSGQEAPPFKLATA